MQQAWPLRQQMQLLQNDDDDTWWEEDETGFNTEKNWAREYSILTVFFGV